MLARSACNWIISPARSETASATSCFFRSQLCDPSLESVGAIPPPPMYFCTRWIITVGTKTFTVTTSDLEGKTATKSVTYAVVA